MKLLMSLLVSFLLITLPFNSFAQFKCGFDPLHEKMLKENDEYKRSFQQNQALIRKIIEAQKKNGTPAQSERNNAVLYTIPVVVHIVHTGDSIGSIYNPTKAQILGAINYLNQVYNGTYPGTQGAGDIEIQFALAQRDPNCNATDGINRVNGNNIPLYTSNGVNVQTTLGTDQINVKNLIRWNTTDYYNIWVVNKIDGKDGTSGSFIAGFAYFPGAPASYDGTVMLATQMRSGEKTLPHEIGHALNLYHPFQGSVGANCAANTNCNLQGDEICDTDPITEPAGFTCRTGPNSCPPGAPYTINTESNYMNYTNCYTLFTADQKARMIAAMSLPGRSSLGLSLGATPPQSGAITCPPKINFEISEDQKTEKTTGTINCRKYTDYTYNMLIGNSPSQAATATLNITGTVTEAVDIDITTNGNFSTPSKVLNFPAGSIAPQTFTLRIYDDAEVEGNESFTIGFTVNSGGGNAVAGDGKNIIHFIINDNDQAPLAGTVNGTASIGSITASFTGTPFDASLAAKRTQFLYKATELITAGVPQGEINALALNLQKFSTRSYQNLTIKIGTTLINNLIDGSVFPINTTVVKTIPSYATVNGWNNFTFDTPFNWDGTSNLVFEICYDNGSAAADAGDRTYLFSDGGTVNQGNLFFQNINCAQNFSTVTFLNSGFKPVVQMGYGIPPANVETVLNASRSEYLGPLSDIYFYAAATGDLMARIKNNSLHDYGCTQVLIDRAGNASAAFWNNNPTNYLLNKTFRVMPTNNNPAGNYEISLYFTQDEINGWQTATGQSFNNVQIVKVQQQISDVTPANPNGGGTVQIVTPSITTLGTNQVLSYNFGNGFSGFGAGIAGFALPLQLLNFTVKENNQSALLIWNTNNEINTLGFDIERSADGILFEKIGYTPAGSNSRNQYEFRDDHPLEGKNYYRLKMLDKDYKFEYSKTLWLVFNQTKQPIIVLNNPFNNYIDIVKQSNLSGPFQITLYNASGKKLLQKNWNELSNSRLRLDVSNYTLSKGIYWLQFTGKEYSNSFKLLKQ